MRPFLLPEERHLVVADLGGDAGQFIPLDLAREAYVIEASQQQPVHGVTRVMNLSDLTTEVGLLMCSHVLEHIPDPISFLRLQLSSSRIRPGCLIYLEVPMERYALFPALGSGLYSRYLKCVLKMPLVLICIDFFSVLSRSFLGLIMPPLILKMHEHINFFSAQSLRIMIKSLGLVLLEIGVESESNLATHQGVIRALARKC